MNAESPEKRSLYVFIVLIQEDFHFSRLAFRYEVNQERIGFCFGCVELEGIEMAVKGTNMPTSAKRSLASHNSIYLFPYTCRVCVLTSHLFRFPDCIYTCLQ